MTADLAAPWWMCPNEPGCPHPGLIHDIYDADDTRPRCCAEGCDCGKRPEDAHDR
jgi:hypothetical protein